MRRIIVIVVALFFLKPIFPVLDYLINYNYIANELCENKAKPELQCNGKCHLAKELAEKSEKNNPLENKQNTTVDVEVLFFQEVNIFSFSTLLVPARMSPPKYSNNYGYLTSITFFHPPTC